MRRLRGYCEGEDELSKRLTYTTAMVRRPLGARYSWMWDEHLLITDQFLCRNHARHQKIELFFFHHLCSFSNIRIKAERPLRVTVLR
jgi:hypothetical protein